jgi:hypothetical protein
VPQQEGEIVNGEVKRKEIKIYLGICLIGTEEEIIEQELQLNRRTCRENLN